MTTNHATQSRGSFIDGRRTGLVYRMPFGIFQRSGSRVLCGDGKIRSLAYLAKTADTFYSVPAAVRIGGRYVSGYVTTFEASPSSQGHKVSRTASIFVPLSSQSGKHSLPEFPDRFSDTAFTLLASA